MDLGERLHVLLLKLLPYYLLFSHVYENNSNKGIEEEYERGMHWFRLLNTAAFIRKDVYCCTDLSPFSWVLYEYEH